MKIPFQSGRDQPFMQKKKKREKAVTTKQDGLSLHKYRYLSFPVYAVKIKL